MAATTLAGINPGEYRLIPEYPPIYRPATSQWVTESTSETTVISRRLILEYDSGVNRVDRVGGYKVATDAFLTVGPVAIQSRVAQYLDILRARYFVEYLPVNNEVPTDTYVKALVAHNITVFVADDPNTFMTGGSGQCNFNNQLMLSAAPFALSSSPNTSEINRFQNEAVVYAGGTFSQEGTRWVLRSTFYSADCISTAIATAGGSDDNTGSSASSRGRKITKVTWVEDQQVDWGWLVQDIDGDGEVGPTDFMRIVYAWGSDPLSSTWDYFADINGDGEVGPADYNLFMEEWLSDTFVIDSLVETTQIGHW